MLNGERRITVGLDFSNVGEGEPDANVNAAKHHIGNQIHIVRNWAQMDKIELGDVGYWEDTDSLIALSAYPASQAPDGVTLEMSIESAAKLWPAFRQCRARLLEYERCNLFDQREYRAAADWFAYAARTVADAIPA